MDLPEAGNIHAMYRPYTALLSMNVTHNIPKNIFNWTGKMISQNVGLPLYN